MKCIKQLNKYQLGFFFNLWKIFHSTCIMIFILFIIAINIVLIFYQLKFYLTISYNLIIMYTKIK